MKYLSLVLLFSFLLTGCFGGDSGTVIPYDYSTWVRQEFSTFVVQVPSNWNRVDKSKLSSAIPENTVAVYAALMENGFIKNMNVVKEKLNTNSTHREYADASMILTKASLPQYTLIADTDTDIHGQKTILHTFTARNSASDSLVFFMQAYFVKDDIGYTITCALPGDSLKDVRSVCDQIVTSFELK